MYRRYRWSMDGYGRPPVGKGVIGLIVASGICFLMQMASRHLIDVFVLDPSRALPELKLYQLVTYMFLHGGFFHLFINLFVLYMFGRELEGLWGTSRFLFYYFVSGIGAGLVTALLSRYPVVGASGAIYGLLLAYGVLFPNRTILLWFFIPMKAKYLVILFAVLEFFASMGGGGDGISHITHLGGMVFGGALLAIWHLGGTLKRKRRMSVIHDLTGGPASPANIDRILDKVLREGVESLTEDEKRILIRAGKFYQRDTRN